MQGVTKVLPGGADTWFCKHFF